MLLSCSCCNIAETLIAPIFTGHVPIAVSSDRAVSCFSLALDRFSTEGIVRVNDERPELREKEKGERKKERKISAEGKNVELG